MAVGLITQYQGPIEAGVNIASFLRRADQGGGACKIGISLDEKDFYQCKDGFWFKINGELYQMGRTCIYQSDDYFVLNQLSFPNGAPKSILVQATS